MRVAAKKIDVVSPLLCVVTYLTIQIFREISLGILAVLRGFTRTAVKSSVDDI